MDGNCSLVRHPCFLSVPFLLSIFLPFDHPPVLLATVQNIQAVRKRHAYRGLLGGEQLRKIVIMLKSSVGCWRYVSDILQCFEPLCQNQVLVGG